MNVCCIISFCVCMCARARARACVHACECMCDREREDFINICSTAAVSVII